MIYVFLYLAVVCLFCLFICVITLYNSIKILKRIESDTISIYELIKEKLK